MSPKKRLFVLLLCFLLLCTSTYANPRAKNVILLIGDGMGTNQRLAATSYLGQSLHMDGEIRTIITTHSANSAVTDSAAAATALATGQKTNNGYLSISPDGEKLTTILEKAAAAGKATGLVATSTITHATPAAFAAHRNNRNDELGVALDFLDNKVDLLLGGGRQLFLPISKGGRRTDGRDLTSEFQTLGYKYLEKTKELESLSSLPALGLFIDEGFPYAIENDGSLPTMAQMTKKALELLSQNQEGFFLMVEGSQIDWTCHANDPAATFFEIVAFDEAVAEALRFATDHPETLVVVVGDHETGGLKLGEGDPGALRSVRTSSRKLAQILDADPDRAHELFCEYTGICPLPEELKKLLAGNLEAAISKFLSQQAGLSWSTGGHTKTPLPLTAFGQNAKYFLEAKDNTQVPKLIGKAMGIEF